MVARLVDANGLAETLWCCAPAVLDMMRRLWHTGVAPMVGWDGAPLPEDGEADLDLDADELED